MNPLTEAASFKVNPTDLEIRVHQVGSTRKRELANSKSRRAIFCVLLISSFGECIVINISILNT